jgi:hypothetical protein
MVPFAVCPQACVRQAESILLVDYFESILPAVRKYYFEFCFGRKDMFVSFIHSPDVLIYAEIARFPNIQIIINEIKNKQFKSNYKVRKHLFFTMK